MISLRVALTHPSDLFECGAVIHEELNSKRDTMKIQVKMVGTGSASPAFYLKMIDKRRKRILMTMRSQKFLEDNHEFANFLKKNDGSTWTLKE